MNDNQDYKTDLDEQINFYLDIYKSTFDLQGATSWWKFIYLMVDELLRNGLEKSDVLFIKQKYAEFRCSVTTDDKKRQISFNKIVTTYTNAINSICERCERYGKVHTIHGWDYRLCIPHYLEQANIALAENTNFDLTTYHNDLPELKESHYRNVPNRNYNVLNDEFIARDISILHHYLKENNIEKSVIRKILIEFAFIDKNFGGIVHDEKAYFRRSFFIDNDDNQVIPDTDLYDNEDFVLDLINRLCG